MRVSMSASMGIAAASHVPPYASHARRVAGAPRRRVNCVVRAATRWHSARNRAASFVSRATESSENGDDDERRRRDAIDAPSEWRDGPEPSSPFGSLFQRAALEKSGEQKRVSSDATTNLSEYDACADAETAASPFCSITFIDESEDDGEGAFNPPMDDRLMDAIEPPGAPVKAWPPWLAEEVTETFDEGKNRAGSAPIQRRKTDALGTNFVESTFVEVCAGKACTKKGSAEIHAAILAAAPETWRCEQRKKCWGLCQAACVVRVTKGTAQTTHVRVTPAAAVATVVTPSPFKSVPRTNFVYSKELETEKETTASERRAAVKGNGPSLPWSPPAGAGLMAAAKAAVEKGVVDRVEPENDRRETSQTKKSNRPGLTRAQSASERVADVFQDAASYVFAEPNSENSTRR